jgi:hypothetical protein
MGTILQPSTKPLKKFKRTTENEGPTGRLLYLSNN